MQGLSFGPLGPRDLHLCVDMQRLFAEETDWHTPWMMRVLPNVTRLAEAFGGRAVFTRFVPPRNAGEVTGTWVRYYRRWRSMTLEQLGLDMVDLVPALAGFAPPAYVVDKRVYSPWMDRALDDLLDRLRPDALVISGGETDVCVLATVLGAVDRGYRVILATDALCSSSDAVHDAALDLYHQRYGQQVETATTAEIVAAVAG